MGLRVMFLVALLLSAVGFLMYVYFFSVGYGFSIAGIGCALLFLFKGRLHTATLVMCILLIVYGMRLGGYLLLRQWKSSHYKSLLKKEISRKVKLSNKILIWVSCALLYVCECAPVLFRLESGKGTDIFAIIGMILMAAGIVLEIMADWQKTKAKREKPDMFVSTGLYRYVRCPNYFGELLLWTGVFVSGLNVCQTFGQWLVCVIGYVGIVYVMFSGARRLELRQDKNYGGKASYQQYVRTTPIIIPLVPIYSVKRHKWLIA